MANSISAEPMAAPQRNPADVDKPLTQETKSSGSVSQPHLRVVHSADRFQGPSGSMPPTQQRQASDRAPAMLDRTVQAQIGRLLRDVFADVADEPVPDRFIALLAQLDAKEKRR
jgi:hypothetical protein